MAAVSILLRMAEHRVRRLADGLRHRIDTSVAGLANVVDRGWIVHERLPPNHASSDRPKAQHGWLALVWCAGGHSHSIADGSLRYRTGHLTCIPPATFLAHRSAAGAGPAVASRMLRTAAKPQFSNETRFNCAFREIVQSSEILPSEPVWGVQR